MLFASWTAGSRRPVLRGGTAEGGRETRRSFTEGGMKPLDFEALPRTLAFRNIQVAVSQKAIRLVVGSRLVGMLTS